MYGGQANGLNDSSPSGITLKLIPPKSPTFIPNLTIGERMQILVQHSHARARHLSYMLSSTNQSKSLEYSLQRDLIPTPIMRNTILSLPMVEVGIGTFNNDAYKSYFLVMDTGSSFTWTQCEGCRVKPKGNCFPQEEDYFPNSKSKSYVPFNPPSTYNQHYEGGGNSSGFRAKETFNFPSTSSSSARIKFPNIVFGCGINNHLPLGDLQIAGVFGMGLQKTSFIRQIETQSGGRFSYCLVPTNLQNPPPMYLRFGTNIKLPRSSKTLNLLKSPLFYIVKMIDLGVNGERLHIKEEQFYSKDLTSTKGLVVDSGSLPSVISKEAYKVIVSKLEKYFSQYKEEFKKDEFEGWLCYESIKRQQRYKNIPRVTYYFEGGVQLDLDPESSFMALEEDGKQLFCLGILPSEFNSNILGAFQQANFKFIYNIKDMTLKFGREDCAKNG
ncbi:unnamed protein product [Lupinus luteus]|uniref:Peptidase A1 domain-containing protein n=1 Tax=Lupinus luteus TaxID=3873 RepID=A0AAV1X6L6_LUPLU